MPCTVQCVPVASRWVAQVILTANCTLAVWFRDGFCCEYLGTTQAWFHQMLAAPSKGHFVRQFLYKKMAYRRIRPPCPPGNGGTVQTTCCGNALPATLHATLNQAAGSVALTYDGWHYWTALGIVLNCGDTIDLRFACGGSGCGSFTLDFRCNGILWVGMIVDALGCTCSPLSVSFNSNLSTVLGCPACNGHNLTATVTP
jgi:hypothetical protein